MTAEILNNVKESEYHLLPEISNTSLGHFLISPAKYHAVKYDGAPGLDSSGFKMGSALDVYFLTPDEFDERYVVLPVLASEPGSPQQNEFVRLMLEGYDHVNAYKQCGYKLDKKTEAAIIKSASDLYDELKDYILFYSSVNGREMITNDQFNDLALMRQSIMRHPRGVDFEDVPNGKTIFNQAMIKWSRFVKIDGENVEFVLRGMIDRLMIFPDQKKVIIYDLKTTSKTKSGFKYYIPIYRYDWQAAMYVDAVRSLIADAFEGSAYDWDVEFRLMAVQSQGLYEAFCIDIPMAAISDIYPEIDKTLELIHWHEMNDIWHITKEAFDNDGIETYTPNTND